MNESKTDGFGSTPEQIANRAKLYERTLNRLCRWRTVFTGWFIGTKAKEAPGVQAWRDLADTRLIQRVEMNATLALLLDKGIITVDELKSQIVIECDAYQKELEAKFPGHVAIEDGIRINGPLALETYKRLGFPE